MNVPSHRWRLLSLVLLGFGALLLAGCGNNGSADVPPTAETTSPSAVAVGFFHWYVSERNLGRDPMSRASLQANAGVTTEFINKMEAATAGGRDPMLCSGEVPHAFTAGEPVLSGTVGRVSVAASDLHAAWEVNLKQEGTVWRITSITCAAG